jgi:hypothetical protein
MLRLVLLTILGTAVVSASFPADHHYIVIGTEQTRTTPNDEAETIINKAVQKLGGDRYLKVTSQVSRGKFSVIRDGVIVSFQSFIDVIVYPDKERTEFKGSKSKFVQTNVGNTGWTFDSDHELVKNQTEAQIENFHRGIRVSLDTLLRGGWKGKGQIEYIGKRPASLGKRNDVIRLKYEDGLTIDFEFAEDGTPMKASYKKTNAEGEETTEEDRYAQWVDVNGIRTPYIVDRFTNGKPTSRINYESLEYNVRVPESIFDKPSNPKELKKDLKL